MNTEPTTPTPEAPAPQKVVLLGKEHDITAFASGDPTRYIINSVHYNEKAQCLEACSGWMLIQVPVELSEDFLALSQPYMPAKDTIIPLAPFKKALSSIPNGGTVPVLKHIALSTAYPGDKVRMTTNDLDTENNVVTKCVEGNYPRTDQVIPTKAPTFSIALDPGYLQTIAAYFTKHGSEKDKALRLEFTADNEAVRFSGTLASGKRATGVLMPMRLS